MYGESSFSFEYNKIKFIFFYNVVWENNNSKLDFEWLNNALSNLFLYNHVLLMSHISPFGDQFNDDYKNEYIKAVITNNISLTLHGHAHYYSLFKYFDNKESLYFTAKDVKKRVYYKLLITKNNIEITEVEI